MSEMKLTMLLFFFEKMFDFSNSEIHEFQKSRIFGLWNSKM